MRSLLLFPAANHPVSPPSSHLHKSIPRQLPPHAMNKASVAPRNTLRNYLSARPLSRRFSVPAQHIRPVFQKLGPFSNTPSRTMSTKPPSELAKIKETVPLDTKDAKWTKLQKIHYMNPSGEERDWEMAARTTRSEGSEIDGVGIIALIKDKSNPESPPQVVLQKQFRPPVGAVVIEFPAGLLDPNESPLTCAIRELHEETGYVVDEKDHISNSELMFNDPGFTNTNLINVMVEVDINRKENQHPQPQLEENEFIETFTLDLKSLPEELAKFTKKGYKVDSKVAALSAGIQLSKTFNLAK